MSKQNQDYAFLQQRLNKPLIQKLKKTFLRNLFVINKKRPLKYVMYT